MLALSDLEPETVDSVKESFSEMRSDFSEIVSDLYPTFISRYPEYADFFDETSFRRQREAVEKIFSRLIPTLDTPEVLRDELENLRRIHRDHEVPGDAYKAMGEVIIDLLADYAGSDWNEELETAWTKFWQALSGELMGE